MNDLPIQLARLLDATEVAQRLHLPKARERHKWACPACPSSDALHVYPGPGRGSTCFSCGRSFDAIALAMRVGGLGFIDAIKWLAEEFGFADLIKENLGGSRLEAKRRLKEIERRIAEREKERARLEHERRQAARDVWDQMWPKMTLGLDGSDYLTGRGIPYEVAEHVGIRSVETKQAWEYIRSGFSDDELLAAGLVGGASGDTYPVPWRVPFLVIPYWLEESGIDIIRFRDLTGDAPKYLSPLGHRPTTAYMSHGLADLSDEYPTLYVCEGEINALSVTYAGAPALGACGSSTWDKSWSYELKWWKQVIVLSDGDDAGRKFAQRVYDSTCEVLGRDWANQYLKIQTFKKGVDANDALVSGHLKEVVCG